MAKSLKYEPLTDWLLSSAQSSVEITFGELANIVGGLPNSASKFAQWWENSGYHSQAKAWLAAGYRIDAVNRGLGTVRFKKR